MTAQTSSDQQMAHTGVGHPSPQRRRVRNWVVGFGLLAAPLAWIIQLLFAVGLASYSCYPHDIPLKSELWGWLNLFLMIVNGVAVVVCIAAGLVSWHIWRLTHTERPGSGHHVLETGDGRTRFFAMTGMLASTLFLLAVLLQASNVLLVPACSG